jgi:hypothetical protein
VADARSCIAAASASIVYVIEGVTVVSQSVGEVNPLSLGFDLAKGLRQSGIVTSRAVQYGREDIQRV